MSDAAPIRILYMEDDAGTAWLLQKHLLRQGYAVDIAADGRRGLDMYAKDAYDLIIVDQKMPIYSGLRVIQELASGGEVPPTVMVTGAGDEKTAVEAMRLGASDYIIKDGSEGYIQLMPSVVERALNQKRLTDQKEAAERALRKAFEELEAKTVDLEELNVALKVLLKKRELDRMEYEDNIVLNVKQLIMPCLLSLKQSRLGPKQRESLQMLEMHIEEIISPFAKKLSSPCFDLTPMEIRVAHLIKEGKISKEIADFLNLSESTILFHRHNIRKKLGLNKHKVNLKSYLRSLP